MDKVLGFLGALKSKGILAYPKGLDVEIMVFNFDLNEYKRLVDIAKEYGLEVENFTVLPKTTIEVTRVYLKLK